MIKNEPLIKHTCTKCGYIWFTTKNFTGICPVCKDKGKEPSNTYTHNPPYKFI